MCHFWPILYIRKPASYFWSQKTIFQYDYSPIHTMVKLLYWTAQSTFGYDTVIRRTWVMAAGSNFAFKIAAKPLQLDMWLGLLLAAYRNYHRPTQQHHRCPLTTYGSATYMRFRQTTDRRHIVPKARPNGRPKQHSIGLLHIFCKN